MPLIKPTGALSNYSPSKFFQPLEISPVTVAAVVSEVPMDSWAQAQTIPQTNWAARAAMFAVALAAASGMAPIDTNALTKPETVHVEAWVTPSSLPLYAWGRSVPSGSVLVGSPPVVEVVSLNAWVQPPSPPPPRRSYTAALGASGSTLTGPIVTTETVTLDKWYRPAGEPVRTLITRQQGQQLSLFPDDSILCWYQQHPVPIYKISRQYPEPVVDPTLLTQPESVSIDKFRSVYPDFVRGRGTLQPLLSVFDLKPPTAQPDQDISKWHPIYPDSVRGCGTPQHLQSVFDLKPLAVQPDQDISKWHPLYHDRIMGLGGIVPTGAVLVGPFTPVADTVNISWVQPVSQPVRVPRPSAPWSIPGSQRSFSVTPRIQPRSYYPDFIPHRFPEAVYAASGSFFVQVVSAEIITLDKWFAPPSQPVCLRARDVALFLNVIDPQLLTQKESVSIDKFQPTYPIRLVRIYPIAVLVSGGVLVPSLTTPTAKFVIWICEDDS